MQSLIILCDEVDKLAKSDQEWNGKYISGSHCCLSLCPNPFTVNWRLQEDFLKSIDWADAKEVGKACEMKDESYKPLPNGTCRVGWQELKNFYGSLGFAECEGLGFNTRFNGEHIVKECTTLGRSYAIQRWPMIYPAKHGDLYRENEQY